MWQSVRLSVLSCGSVCRSCVTVIARLASTHTALVSQSLVGLCFAFPSINQSFDVGNKGRGAGLSRNFGKILFSLGGARPCPRSAVSQPD